MNELKIFNNEEFGSVRTTEINGKTYFVGNDVAKALGYVECAKAIRTHCKGVSEMDIPSNGGMQKMKVIPEGDIYRLVIKSQLPTAEKFESWIFDEVIPSIRKNGAYLTDQKAMDLMTNPQSLIELLEQAAEQLKQKDIRIEEMKPKEIFADAVATSNTSILIGELAKLLKQNGVDIGQNRLFKWLRENHYLMSSNEPTQYSMERGLFEVLERTVNNPDGSVRITRTTKVTGKGQQYFINKFLCV